MKISVFFDHIIQAVQQQGLDTDSDRDMDNFLKGIRKLGIEAVEINYSYLRDNKERITRLLKKNDIGISCIYDFYDFTDYDGKTDGDMRMLFGHINMASELDAAKILVVPGFINDDYIESGDMDIASGNVALTQRNNMAVALKAAVEYAHSRNVYITLEDFDDKRAPYATAQGLLWFLNNVPGLKLTFDMGNFAYSGDDVSEAYELLKGYICHVHCKDRGLGLSTVHVGGGILPVDKLVRKLRSCGYNGYYAIEHFDAVDQAAYIKKSFNFLHECLDE